jgi:predicted aspartyl protease
MTACRRKICANVATIAFAAMTMVPSTASAVREGETAMSAPTLEFLNAPAADAPLVDVPRLAIGIGGRMHQAVVDTGSTGVVLSASGIPDIDHLPSQGPGTITYSSSGRIMLGRWVVTPIVIAGRRGRIVTRPIPILAVDAIACTATARRCTPEAHPTHVAMLGIGFGREHDRQPGGTPERNPLLNVAAPAGLPRSYVLSRRGIRVGATRDGFVTVELARDSADRDWSAPAACIAVERTTPACGTILVDTGVTGMFLTVPADRLPDGSDGRTVPPATSITIDLAPATPGGIAYTIRADDPHDAASPSAIVLAGVGKRAPFVNTGAHFLNRFDYLYDADAGLVGYRPRESGLP